MWTNARRTTVAAVRMPTVSIRTEVLAAAAETVTTETDFAAAVNLSPFCAFTGAIKVVKVVTFPRSPQN